MRITIWWNNIIDENSQFFLNVDYVIIREHGKRTIPWAFYETVGMLHVKFIEGLF